MIQEANAFKVHKTSLICEIIKSDNIIFTYHKIDCLNGRSDRYANT